MKADLIFQQAGKRSEPIHTELNGVTPHPARRQVLADVFGIVPRQAAATVNIVAGLCLSLGLSLSIFCGVNASIALQKQKTCGA